MKTHQLTGKVVDIRGNSFAVSDGYKAWIVSCGAIKVKVGDVITITVSITRAGEYRDSFQQIQDLRPDHSEIDEADWSKHLVEYRSALTSRPEPDLEQPRKKGLAE